MKPVKSLALPVGIAANGIAIVEVGQVATGLIVSWVTGVGVAVLLLGIGLSAVRLRRAQRLGEANERPMFVLLGGFIAAAAVVWLFFPAHPNGDEWQSIWTVHDLCATGAFDSGPCAESSVDLAWLAGVATLAIGALTALAGWYITAFEPADGVRLPRDIPAP